MFKPFAALSPTVRGWLQGALGGLPIFARLVALASVFAGLAVTLKELGTLLMRAESPDQAFGPGVFTGFSIRTGDLLAAAGPKGIWTDSSDGAADLMVSAHLTVDLVFALVVGLVLAALLESVNGGSTPLSVWVTRRLPLLYVALDLAETVMTKVIFGCPVLWGSCGFGITENEAGWIHALSDAKWAAFYACVFVVVASFLLTGYAGAWSLTKTRTAFHTGFEGVPGPPGGLVVLVVLFTALLALPAGGALDQMPDVLRAQLDDLQDGQPSAALWSLGSLVVFLVVVFLVARPGMRGASPGLSGNVVALIFGAAPTVLLLGAYSQWGEDWGGSWPVIAIALVVAGVAALGTLVGRQWPLGELAAATETPAAVDAARRRGAVLVACVVLAALLGLLRAVLPIVAVPGDAAHFDTTTVWVTGLLIVILPAAVALAAYKLFGGANEASWRVRVVEGIVFVAVLWQAWRMAVDPTAADGRGATGTLTLVLSAYAVLIGGFAWLTRNCVWRPTQNLRLGTRTPWLGLLVVAWLVAGALEPRGGYHDARTEDAAAARERVATLGAGGDDSSSSALATPTTVYRFRQWSALWRDLDAAQLDECAPRNRARMVLVAAPGGGAKAAYWTAGGMDRLFGADGACPLSLFAASGVSGGALGLTTRFAIAPTSPTDPLPPLEPDAPSPLLSQPVVEELTGEDPLARTISAMLLRDLPQPFTAIRSAWSDRAAVMEDAWTAATDVFTVYDPDPASGADDHRDAEKNADGRDVTLLDLGVGWWPAGAPILVLNGTSVTDGCRALVANVRLLPVRSDSCLDVPGSGEWRSGSVSAAVAPLKGLRPATGYDGGADGNQPNSLCPDPKDTVQTVRATTAALLAARFPYVTPSGALRRCASNEVRTTYVVDGGYVENTGLLTLLQMWSKIERRVTVCNTWAQQQHTHQGRRGERSKIRLPSQCPRTSDGTALLIEPWVVLLENHYRSVTPHEQAKRPREVFVPPATALGKQRTTTSTVSLEQAALSEMRGDVATRRGSTCSRFMRLAPNVKVEVQAPLGWVLSSGTRATMTASLEASWSKLNGSTNPCVTWNSP